jgi:hypothetical protein
MLKNERKRERKNGNTKNETKEDGVKVYSKLLFCLSQANRSFTEELLP